MKTKYFNDAFVGNGKITASFSKVGELLRLYYPTIDYKQFFEDFHIGVKINDSALIYLHNDINNIYEQEYVENTNILKTKIINTYFNLEINQIDFVPIKENVLIKKYKFKNLGKIDLNINLLEYSKVISSMNNDTCGYLKNDCLIQYNHAYSVCTFSKNKILSCQINNVDKNFSEGVIGDKDYIGMSSVSGISYNIGNLKPNEQVEFSLFIYINDNLKESLISDLDSEIEHIRKLDVDKELDETKKYWQRFVKDHDKLGINRRNIDPDIKKNYNRSILLFSLLTNKETGGVSAGIEVDEQKTKCGRYSYCWTRDAVFITKAFDILNMQEETEKFYKVFCKKTQSKNGMWEQRFYTDGKLAPCWGYQIDETASVVYGIWHHYKVSKDKKFLKDTLKMCENAMNYLDKYVENMLENGHSFKKSYDLWEEYEGYSLYSVSAIYSAYHSMNKIYETIKDTIEKIKLNAINQKIKEYEEKQSKIKDFAIQHFYKDEKKCFVRNEDDQKIDISLLGIVYPFGMFNYEEKKVCNTVEKIHMNLRTYTGGYVRYEGDGYMGGYNPWPIATLWMACYYIIVGDRANALESFNFVTKSASNHGLFGEQVNNDGMKPSWVIGLTWSHAMYIVTLKKLIDEGIL
jgi:oligosaccharide amylase